MRELMTVKAIGEKYGISMATVMNRLREAGLTNPGETGRRAAVESPRRQYRVNSGLIEARGFRYGPLQARGGGVWKRVGVRPDQCDDSAAPRR